LKGGVEKRKKQKKRRKQGKILSIVRALHGIESIPYIERELTASAAECAKGSGESILGGGCEERWM
jgi:hypothetical protein